MQRGSKEAQGRKRLSVVAMSGRLRMRLGMWQAERTTQTKGEAAHQCSVTVHKAQSTKKERC
jgi:hypothetical protein